MNPSQKSKFPDSEKIIWTLLICILTIWSYFSFHSWISDSEFWPITVSRELLNIKQTTHLDVFYKPLFYSTLFWLHLLPFDSVSHVMAAKFIFTIFGFLNFILVFKITSRYIGHLKGFFLILMLLSCAMLFSNAGAIRSDVLVTFLALVGIFYWDKVTDLKWGSQLAYWIFWSILLFLTTPKAIYLIFILFISYGFICEKKKYFHLAKGIFTFATLALGLICLCYLTHIEERPWRAFISALNHGIKAQAESGINFSNPWLKSYIKNDIGYYIVGILFLCGGCQQWFRLRVAHLKTRYFLILSLLISVFIIFYEPKHLFFVSSLLPLWALGWVIFIEKLKVKYLAALLILLVGINLLNQRNLMYFYSNDKQLSALKDIESYLAPYPDATLLDGVGLLPRSSKKLLFIGPQDENNNDGVVSYVLKNKPEYILSTTRVLSITGQFSQFLAEEYEVCEMGLMARKNYCHEKKMTWSWRPWELFSFSPFKRIQ